MWLGKLVSSPLVTCCGTGISASAVAAFTRLSYDWITRGFVTPSGGEMVPRLVVPREPGNCAEVAGGGGQNPPPRGGGGPQRFQKLRPWKTSGAPPGGFFFFEEKIEGGDFLLFFFSLFFLKNCKI